MLAHGGNLRIAAAQYGRPLSDWIDLSTGINPVGYPAPSLATDVWQRLPEADPEFLAAACAYYHAPALLPVAGTQAAIQAMPHLRPPSQVVVAAPSYAEHAHGWRRARHAVRELPFAALDAAVDGCDVMVVCNPNNPTGERIAPERLLTWSARLAARGGWLVVDEAFGDTEPHNSVAAARAPGLIVLRSVGKFFGLAGLRLGFVAADLALLDALNEMLGPWTVSGPAQQIGKAALEDRAWQAHTRTRLLQQGARLQALLAAHGIQSAGTPLFQYWQEPQAIDFQHQLAHEGIWVRRFDGIAPGIRVGLPGGETGWQRLEQALAAWNRMEKAA